MPSSPLQLPSAGPHSDHHSRRNARIAYTFERTEPHLVHHPDGVRSKVRRDSVEVLGARGGECITHTWIGSGGVDSSDIGFSLSLPDAHFVTRSPTSRAAC